MKLATESFINSVGVEKGLLYLLFKRKRAGKVNLWLKSISIVCPSPQGISRVFIIRFSSRKLKISHPGDKAKTSSLWDIRKNPAVASWWNHLNRNWALNINELHHRIWTYLSDRVPRYLGRPWRRMSWPRKKFTTDKRQENNCLRADVSYFLCCTQARK